MIDDAGRFRMSCGGFGCEMAPPLMWLLLEAAPMRETLEFHGLPAAAAICAAWWYMVGAEEEEEEEEKKEEEELARLVEERKAGFSMSAVGFDSSNSNWTSFGKVMRPSLRKESTRCCFPANRRPSPVSTNKKMFASVKKRSFVEEGIKRV